MWCFGSQSGRRTLRVTNNRAYPIVVRYSAEAFEIGKQPDRDVSVVTLYRAYLSMVTGGGDQPQLPLLPGSTVELLVRTDLGESGAWDVFTEWDGLAMAAEMLGLKMILMDAGSGASRPVSAEMIAAVSGAVSIPLIVGGGIRSAEKVQENLNAGADVIVMGNAFEHDPSLLIDISATIHSHNVTLNVNSNSFVLLAI